MSKNKQLSIKNLFNYIPIITIGITLVAGWVKLNAQSEDNREEIKFIKTEIKSKIEKVETDIKEIATEGEKEIKELKEDIKDTESKVNVNKTQQDNIQAQVQQVSEKTDKIYDVLLELKAKKK